MSTSMSLAAVMMWRQVSSLANADEFASTLNGWPRIGVNRYAVMYDAGSVIMGMWSRRALMEPAFMACLDGLVTHEQALIANPTSQFVIRPHDIRAARQQLARARGASPVANREDNEVEFLDRDGNYAAYVRSGPGVHRASDTRTPGRSRLVAHRIMVSDVSASIDFYNGRLGLPLIHRDATEAIFEAGPLDIVVRPESADGLIKSLRGSNRMEGDSLAFYAPAIDRTHDRLQSSGVTFMNGITTSPHGRVAAFEDPDGHWLGLWQPPEKPGDIDYFPVLHRILATLGGAVMA